jgi:anti-sigma regulatory factor (Ser/Thr protein kinase)
LTATHAAPETPRGYHHEALLYSGTSDLMAAVTPFVAEAVAADEPILVVLDAAKNRALREALGSDAERVEFADMRAIGRNPARIMPAWQDFVDRRARPGTTIRGIGEPVWLGRTPAELVECRRHEHLLNVAFDCDFVLLCPYDVDALDPAVIDQARDSHPLVREAGRVAPSPRYPGAGALSAPFDDPLPRPPGAPPILIFQVGGLREARAWVGAHAAAAGLPPARARDLQLAVNEIAKNSLTHGGGGGTVSVWVDGEALICEVRDGGQITDPLADRRRPPDDAPRGRGMWVANQICDLVQVRTSPAGTIVRLHLRMHGETP